MSESTTKRGDNIETKNKRKPQDLGKWAYCPFRMSLLIPFSKWRQPFLQYDSEVKS